ncbi:MAG: TlpA disulfide reductase family protein [Bacteroidota bacterium]
MNTTKFSFIILLLSLFLFGCGPDQPPVTTLELPMDRFESEEVVVFNIEQQIRATFTIEQDSIVLPIEQPTLLNVALGRVYNYVFVRPGDQLSLDTISSDPLVIAPVGERSVENEFLLQLAQTVNEDTERMSFREMGKSEPDSFLIKLDQKYSASEDLVEEIQANANVSADFKAAINNYLLSLQGYHLMNYKYVYNGSQDELPPLPDGFYTAIEKEDLTKNTWLWFDDSRQLVSAWHYKDIDYADFESPVGYFTALLKSAQEAYPGTLVGDYAEYDQLTDFINFGSGLTHAEADVNAFQERVSNTYLLDRLTATVEPWLALKPGEPAPDFLVQDREGKEIRLADLAGQRVYVDVWATWCGPCIREIPSLKALEAELHDAGIQFVSISIDAEKDREKWLNFIEERELGGLQLMADGAWKSDVAQSYNINGIPRFFLIDEAGKIIDANAPRPSDPTVKDILLGEGAMQTHLK